MTSNLVKELGVSIPGERGRKTKSVEGVKEERRRRRKIKLTEKWDTFKIHISVSNVSFFTMRSVIAVFYCGHM